MGMIKGWAKKLKRDVLTLWFALKHPHTPWYAKVLAAIVTAYALSPIDLIPDFIPVLGYLDDIIIVPLGVWLVLKITPLSVMTECRAQVDQWVLDKKTKPVSFAGLVAILSLWVLLAWWFYRWIK